MILADTSAWIQMFRADEPRLRNLLDLDLAVMHDFVLGELACGHLHDRQRTLEGLARLPRAPVAPGDEVLELIEMHKLFGKGVGWIDVHLLAACRLAGFGLLTLDASLAAAARQLKVDY